MDQIHLCYRSFDFHLKVISELTLDLNSHRGGNDRLPAREVFLLSIVIGNENPSPLLDLHHIKIILVLLHSMRLINLWARGSVRLTS